MTREVEARHIANTLETWNVSFHAPHEQPYYFWAKGPTTYDQVSDDDIRHRVFKSIYTSYIDIITSELNRCCPAIICILNPFPTIRPSRDKIQGQRQRRNGMWGIYTVKALPSSRVTLQGSLCEAKKSETILGVYISSRLQALVDHVNKFYPRKASALSIDGAKAEILCRAAVGSSSQLSPRSTHDQPMTENLLDSRLAKDDMPQVLEHRSTNQIRELRVENPLAERNVVLYRPLPDCIATDSKLRTALYADIRQLAAHMQLLRAKVGRRRTTA